MTVQELIAELHKYPASMEVWVATGTNTKLLDNVSTCIDMDTNIAHVQLASEWNIENRSYE